MSVAVRKPAVSLRGKVSAGALGADPDQLNSWKEIARYLEREVRTVQLWEKFEGLPVHRHFHSRQGTIFAFRSEIEGWRKTRMVDRAGYSASSTDPQIKIMAITAEPPVCPLSDLINETIEMLSPAGFEMVTDFESPSADYILRLKSDLEANCIAVELIFAESREVVWSRSLNGETSPSALARSIALLSRSTSLDGIWSTERPANVPTTSGPVAVSKPRPMIASGVCKDCVCAEAEHHETRTWPCLSSGACGFCRCQLW